MIRLWIFLTFVGVFAGSLFIPGWGDAISVLSLMVVTFAAAPMIFVSHLLFAFMNMEGPPWLDAWMMALTWAAIFVVIASFVSHGAEKRQATIIKTASYAAMFGVIALIIIRAEQAWPA